MPKSPPTKSATALLERARAAYQTEAFARGRAAALKAAQQLRAYVLGCPKPDEETARVWVWSQTMAASCARALAEYAHAERLLRETETFVLRAFGPADPLVAEVANEWGIVHKYQGRFAQAEASYKTALPLVARHFGRHSDFMATLLHNLGGITHAQGDLPTAERYARKGLKLRLQVQSAGSLAVAADRAALAAILDPRGKRDEAKQLLTSALRTFKRKLGPRSFEVGVTLETLGSLNYRAGDLGAAERHLKAALDLQQQRLGKQHPELAFALHNLAVVLLDRKRPKAAQALLERAHALFCATVGPRHAHAKAAKKRLQQAERALRLDADL